MKRALLLLGIAWILAACTQEIVSSTDVASPDAVESADDVTDVSVAVDTNEAKDTSDGPCTCPDTFVAGPPCVDLDAGARGQSDAGVAVEACTCPPPGPCDCAGQKATCGFLKGCAPSCGSCPVGSICSNNACSKKYIVKLLKFGERCGQTKDCVPPGPDASAAQQQTFDECRNAQCDGNLCLAGVCTKPCSLQQDNVQNTGCAKKADGVEDMGLPSQCDIATDTAQKPYGTAWRCVQRYDLLTIPPGKFPTVCMPGHTWAPCTHSATCGPGLSCQLRLVLGQWGTHCVPQYKAPAGESYALVGESCNQEQALGPVKVCASNWCDSTWGCRAFCVGDSDCVTDFGACQAGVCANQPKGAAKVVCASDLDCSRFFCRAAGVPLPNGASPSGAWPDAPPPPAFAGFARCYPKGCDVTGDCPAD